MYFSSPFIARYAFILSRFTAWFEAALALMAWLTLMHCTALGLCALHIDLHAARTVMELEFLVGMSVPMIVAYRASRTMFAAGEQTIEPPFWVTYVIMSWVIFLGKVDSATVMFIERLL